MRTLNRDIECCIEVVVITLNVKLDFFFLFMSVWRRNWQGEKIRIWILILFQ